MAGFAIALAFASTWCTVHSLSRWGSSRTPASRSARSRPSRRSCACGKAGHRTVCAESAQRSGPLCARVPRVPPSAVPVRLEYCRSVRWHRSARREWRTVRTAARGTVPLRGRAGGRAGGRHAGDPNPGAAVLRRPGWAHRAVGDVSPKRIAASCVVAFCIGACCIVDPSRSRRDVRSATRCAVRRTTATVLSTGTVE